MVSQMKRLKILLVVLIGLCITVACSLLIHLEPMASENSSAAREASGPLLNVPGISSDTESAQTSEPSSEEAPAQGGFTPEEVVVHFSLKTPDSAPDFLTAAKAQPSPAELNEADQASLSQALSEVSEAIQEESDLAAEEEARRLAEEEERARLEAEAAAASQAAEESEEASSEDTSYTEESSEEDSYEESSEESYEEESSEEESSEEESSEESSVEEESSDNASSEESSAEEESSDDASSEESSTEEESSEALTTQREETSGSNVTNGYTDEEYLAAICQIEAGGTYEGSLAVANCVLNRLKNGRYGSSIYEVIYAPYQFATGNMNYWLENGPGENARRGAADALAGINNLGDYLHFNGVYWLDPDSLDVPHVVIGGNCFY